MEFFKKKTKHYNIATLTITATVEAFPLIFKKESSDTRASLYPGMSYILFLKNSWVFLLKQHLFLV